MFKIESYITPILMNYVAKYVKNIRPQDAQLSLWGGEVALQNLDLRLDVLEEELQLPFEFLSGHIHELIIHVPWTKITSEPIQITINTIEFVLKLKDANATSSSSATNLDSNSGGAGVTSVSADRKKRLSKIEETQQQGYVPGLVNKIINNISINCHNIILKYVEEDIVVSMNVQLLSYSSADEKWQKSFVDVSQTRVLLRKLVQISDLTICLDKRNSIGLIDVCQEPILYRCSLEMRIFKKYNAATLAKTSHTRIDIFSKAMEINVSSLQFPMAMRLLILMKVLKNGDLQRKAELANLANLDATDDAENAGVGATAESYLSWAWNLIPSVFPSDEDLEEIDDHGNGHILDIGVYLGKLNMTLKSSELISDPIVQSTRKIRYDPILKVCLEGIYNETHMIGRKWFNTRAGVSKFLLEPLSNYAKQLSPSMSLLIFTSSEENENYLENSLFQTNLDDTTIKLLTIPVPSNLDDHLSQYTEKYLLHRTPVFAFDMVHFVDIPDDNKSSDFGSDLEYSNLSEHLQIRVFLSSVTLRYNSTLLGLIDAVQELMKTYNYAPYIEEKPEPIVKILPPSVDDFDALMKEIPKRRCELTIKQLQIELHPRVVNELKAPSRKSSSVGKFKRLNSAQLQKFPYLNIYLEQFYLTWSQPLYPNRLIYTTCQLPDKPIELMSSCYDSINFKVKNLHLKILSIYNPITATAVDFLHIPQANGIINLILKPDVWEKDSTEIILQKFECNLKELFLLFTKHEAIIVYNMIQLILDYSPQLLTEILKSTTNSTIQSHERNTLKRIKMELIDLKFSCDKFSDIICYDGKLKFVNIFIIDGVEKLLILRTSNKIEINNKQKDFFRAIIQWPVNGIVIKRPPLIAGLLSNFEFILNKNLVDLLSTMNDLSSPYESEESSESSPPRQELETVESSRKSTVINVHDQRTKRQFSQPQESIHLSSEKEDSRSLLLQKSPQFEENKMGFNFKIGSILKYLIIWIDVKQSKMIICEDSSQTLDEKLINNSTIILFPGIQCKCKELSDLKDINLNFPIHKIFKEWKFKESTFPWICTINNFIVKTQNPIEKSFIHPINASITLVLDDKKFEKSLENDNQKSKHKEKKSSNQIKTENDEILAFNLHIDTKPIFIEISEDQAIIIKQALSLLMAILNFVMPNDQNASNIRVEESEADTQIQISQDETTIKEINDFLALNTNSEDTSSQTITNYSLLQNYQTTIFLLMQWTVTKITFCLRGCTDIEKDIETKLNFDFEDFIISIDCQSDYFKLKCKVGSISMQHYEKVNNNENNDWNASDYFKVKICTTIEDTQQHTSDTFFDLTLTIAETSDYFKRLGIKKNLKNLNKSIAEIDVHLKGIDILLDFEKLLKFIPVLCCISSMNFHENTNEISKRKMFEKSKIKSQQTTFGTLITDLPLLFAQSQGITIYIPIKTGKSWCDVFIFKIGEMHITPLVKHPLVRNPIRPDVYNKAAQLQILDIPGSKLEDRQYEFSLKNISAATGSWKDILSLMKENSVKSTNTNPAFEWNNQSKKTFLELNSIFNDFLLTVTHAPCMTYKNVLVCGIATEINCVTDLIMNFNTHQLHLLSVITETLQSIKKFKYDYEKLHNIHSTPRNESFNSTTKSKKNNAIFSSTKHQRIRKTFIKSDSQINLFDYETTDSGIASFSKPSITHYHHSGKHKTSISSIGCGSKEILLQKSYHSRSEIFIPCKIELVAGLFIFKFFENLRTSDKNQIKEEILLTKTDDEASMSISSTDSNSSDDDLVPLLACSIKTSMLIEYKSHEFITKFFVYTINVNDGSGNKSKNITSNKILETLTGPVDCTGIPPVLLTFEYKVRTFGKKTEIDCIFGCPMKLHMSCDLLQHFAHIADILNQCIIHTVQSRQNENKLQQMCTNLENTERQSTIDRGTKIQVIQKLLYNANRLSISTNKFFIDFKSSSNNLYDVRACFGDIHSIMTITDRPEKLSLYICLDTLYLQTEHKMCLHPIRFKSKLLMTQENWSAIPLLSVNTKIDVIHLDIGTENIKNLYNAFKDFDETLKDISMKFEKTCVHNKTALNQNDFHKRNLLKKISLPKPQRKTTKNLKNKEEFYQDDLRAGAFQFVEQHFDNNLSSSSSSSNQYQLPHPYQIQIMSKNNGIVCWRYPHPRRICKLQIYPVPMDSVQPTTIKCRMEYYSEPHNDFLHYIDFDITEMETKTIELTNEKITACVWRVIILQSVVTVNEECFKESILDDDEDNINENDYININDILKNNSSLKGTNFVLQPKALVACMRIDTAFCSSYIPKIKFFIELSLIQINLQIQQSQQQQEQNENVITNLNLPKLLHKFKLAQNYTNNHTFLTIFIRNSKLFTNFFDFNEFSIDISSTISSKCLDYSNLTMFNFIEDTNLQLLLGIKKGIDINVIIDSLKFNLYTALVHTFLISEQIWLKSLRNLHKNYTEKQEKFEITTIWTRYVICNQTQIAFRVGQIDTNEMMTIAPGYCSFYSFRSCNQSKELIFQMVFNDENHKLITSSQSVSIFNDNDDEDQFVLLGDNVLVVKVFRLSATQKCILLKGQIEIVSQTIHKFRLQFRSSGAYGSFPEIPIDSEERLSIFGKCIESEDLYFRLRFSELNNEQIRWSGEIPLKSRKNLPWLVRIPLNESPEFISFWVRVVKENIVLSSSTTSVKSLKPIRLLIVIYPMFVVQSNFTSSLSAIVKSSLENEITFQGCGEIKEISAAATNDTQHEIVFKNKFPTWHGEDRHNAVLTFSNVDWNKFFWYDDKKTSISEFLNKLPKPFKTKWPYNEINEDSFHNTTRLIQENQNPNNIVPFFKCHSYHELSCSLMMTISPWCILVNTLKHNVTITNTISNDSLKIDAGKITMLFPIENSFLIHMHFNEKNTEKICTSDKIFVEKLQQNHVIQLIFSSNQYEFMSKIFIEHSFNDGLRVITLLSTFTVINLSSYELNSHPFCCTDGDVVGRKNLEKSKIKICKVPKESSKNSNPKGISLDQFHRFESSDRKTKKSYRFYACMSLKNGEEELSLPLPVDEAFNRKCFSLYLNGKSKPFAAVCIEKKFATASSTISSSSSGTSNSQYYLFIYDDTSPVLLIDNQTHISYYVAEIKSLTGVSSTNTSSTANTVDDSPQHNFAGSHTEILSELNNEIKWRQILRPMCHTYYTPPSAYLKFPDTEKYHCDITLALRMDEDNIIGSSEIIQWSAPIHTGYRSEKYFNVPSHGDVKIVVCDKHNTIRVFIFYVSQQTEFCIKDLRTRLLDPNKNLNNEHFQSTSITLPPLSSPQENFNKNNNNEKTTIKQKECNHELSNFPIHLNLFANEIGLNLWSETKEKPHTSHEIFSLFIDDLSLTFNGLFNTLEIHISNLQADNQLYSTGNYDFPVILCSETPYKRRHSISMTPSTLKKPLKIYREKSLAFIHVNFYEDDFTIETIHCQLNPIRAYIEDTYINDVKDQIMNSEFQNIIYEPPSEESLKLFCDAGEVLIPKDVLQHAMSLSEPLKLRYIRIDPINVILSFHTCVKLYVGFDHSPLTFSQYDRRNMLTTSVRFGQTIGMHYISGILFSCGWVVGSLEILGSPSGLARSFSTGIRDFVSMPIQGLFRGPWGFLLGISHGSFSLLRNITAGTLNSVTKLAVSVSRNLDRLTLDEEHFQRTEALRRSRPQGLTQGLSHGLTGLGINLLGAIGGISRHTLEARSTAGVVAGIGKGIFGAIAKPISGAADLVALTGQGMLQTVGYNTLPEQRCQGIVRQIISYPAECKILWQFIPSVLSRDQILFYHEATLIGVEDDLIRAQLILTTTILTVFDMEKDQLIDLLPIERVEMTIDSIDKTLINIQLLREHDQSIDDDSNFTNERIIRFLKASNDSLPPMSRCSLDDLLQTNQKTQLKWSLYIDEHLGQHLFGYLKLIKNLIKKSS